MTAQSTATAASTAKLGASTETVRGGQANQADHQGPGGAAGVRSNASGTVVTATTKGIPGQQSSAGLRRDFRAIMATPTGRISAVT